MPLDLTTFISIGTWLSSKIADKGFDEIYGSVSNSEKIESEFKRSVDKVSKDLQLKYPSVLGGSIEYFFRNKTVFNELFKLLFKSAKIDENKISDIFDISTLPVGFISEFISTLRSELMKNRTFNEILTNNELYILFNGLSLGVEELVQNSIISTKEVEKLSKKIQERFGNEFDHSSFISLYKKNALNNLSQVNFIGLGIDISIKKKRKQLQDIFVKPIFDIIESNRKKTVNKKLISERPSGDLSYDKIFKLGKKIVILGNPGSGKSIVVKSIICDILSNENSNFFGDVKGYIPFRIELRNYLAFKKTHHGNLIKYLISNLENEFQMGTITEPILHKILSHNDCILFFDGLDEIFDIADKIETKNDIENFHNIYPDLRSITTSRNIGYSDASLNEDFIVTNIKNFDNDQITDYVKKWYRKEEDVKEIREREVNDFLTKMHEIDLELLSNPLLLSLIVIIYRNILKLPESKLEIYQSCTKTLVDKWDASKNLIFNLDNSLLKEKDKLFADLAYWQYVQLSNKISTNISYEKAKQTISSSIVRLNLTDELLCPDLAEDFMEYAEKRSIYFDNNFTHKTFLEYYTAYWIYSNIEKKHKVSERNQLIIKYSTNSFWFIVLELLFNLIDKDQGDNDIIDEAVNLLLETSNETHPFLLSVILKLKNISLEVVNKVLRSSILNLLSTKKSTKRDSPIFRGLLALFSHLRGKSLIIDILRSLESERIDSIKQLAEIYTLYCELETPYNSKVDFKLLEKAKFDECCSKNLHLYILSIYVIKGTPSHLHSISTFLKYYGMTNLTKRIPATYDLYIIPGFLYGMVNEIVKDKNLIELLEYCNNQGITYEYLLSSPEIHSNYLMSSEVSNLVDILNNSNSDKVNKFIIILLAGNRNTTIKNSSIKKIKDVKKANLITEISKLGTNEMLSILEKM